MSFQVPPLSCQRLWKKATSSGMFEYQVRKNWAKAMYDQKAIHPKRSLPRSWKCSTFTALPSSPLRIRSMVVRIRMAIVKSCIPAKK